MKQLQAFTSKHALWHRALALLLALSLVLIPVYFPSAANAEAAEFTGPNNYFVDDFTDSRYLDGVTYQWKTIGDHTGAVADGVYRFTYTEASGQYNNYMYPAVTSGETNYGAQWDDYTLEFDSRRLSAAAASGITSGMTYRIWVRTQENTITAGASGAMLGYCIDLTGNLNASGTMCVRKYYLKDGAVTNAIVGGKTASVPTSPDTWYKWKVEVVGNTITVRYNNNVVLSVTDNGDEVSGQPYTNGVPMLGTQGRNGITEYDNVKITPADGSTVMADNFADTRFVDGVTYKWNSNDTNGGWAVENGMLTAKRTSASGATYMGLRMMTGTTDLAAKMTDYAVEVDVSRQTDKLLFSMILRAKNRSNAFDMYRVSININGTLMLVKRHNGSDSATITSVNGLDFKKDTWHTMKAEVQGTVIRVYYDGDLVLTYDTVNDATGKAADGTTNLWRDTKNDKDAANTPYAEGTIGLGITATSAADPTPTALCKNLAVYPIEMSAGRQYDKHLFNVDGVDDLTLWDVKASDTGAWSIANDKLTYADTADAKGLAALKTKTKVENASVVLEGSAVEGGSIAVLGRYSANGYYKMVLDTAEGISLYKSNGTAEQKLDGLTLKEAYALGIRIEPDTVYTLKLQMLDGTIAGFVNDECVLRYADAEPLTAGVGGIEATNGSAFTYLEIAELNDVVTNLEIVESFDYGVNRTNLANATFTTWTGPVQVAVGGVPDIKNLYLKVTYYDGSASYVPLDMADLPAFDVAEAGSKQLTVNYMQGQTTLAYTVLDRADAIAQLNAYAEALDATALTLSDKAALDAKLELYHDLSATEKAQISEANQKKLADARAAMDILVAPELAGSQIVYQDSFDKAISEENYENHMSVTGVRNSGYWHVEDGKFLQYSADDQFRSGSYYAATVIKGKNWSVSSVSADVRIIDKGAWIGLNANFVDGNNVFRLMITDKVMNHAETVYTENGTVTVTPATSGTRVDLYKNSTLVTRRVLTGEEMIQTGEWYNLRMTLVDGKIRVYLDDVELIEWTDITTTATGATSEAGTAGLLSTEGWGEFDNLVVRGVDVPSGKEDTTVTLEPGEFTDDFNDEKDNLNADPSHWIEATSADAGKWVVMQTGENEYAYGTVGALRTFTKTWLHVFETDVDYTADITVVDLGYYPVFGLVARDNATNSYIRAGYDATFQKWFIKVRLGEDFAETVAYSDVAAINEGDTIKLRLLAKGRDLSLYVNGSEEPVVTADAGTKVMPGRVGVYADSCEIIVDNVDLQLLSGQGRVNEGVWEYYAKESNITTSLHQILELPDKNILLLSEGNKWISYDGGKTFTKTSDYVIYGGNHIKLPAGLKFTVGDIEVDTDEGVYIGVQSIKPDRDNYPNWTTYQAFLYTENLGKKTSLGVMPTAEHTYYAQPGDHMNLVALGDGNYRIFFTAGRQSGLEEGRAVLSETYYSDDFGQTWHASTNTPQDFTNLKNWCETKVITINKDVTDFAGNTIPAGTMIQYCSYNTSEFMRYSLSYDGGKTWEGDYVMPTIPTCLGSFSVEEDLYNPGTYYMSTIYNYPYNAGNGRPRHRIALLRSTDGFNWEYLADVDRWGDVSDGGRAEIMQNVNMYIDITKDYVFPGFSRSDAYLNSSSGHNAQQGRVYRFEKSKMQAYAEWPKEYYISPKTILYIEGTDAEITLNSEFIADEVFFTVYHYGENGVSYTEQIPLSEALYTAVDTSVLGEQEIVIDYGMYRDIYTVTVVAGEKPVIEGVEQDKNYCGQQTVTISDANGDLLSVTLDGNVTSLQNGKLVVIPGAEVEEHTIVATDAAGNTTTVTFKVYPAHSGGSATCEDKAVCSVCNTAYGELAAHKGGTATCTDKAKCDVCGESYGELNADKHTKDAKWTITGDKHSKAYECCGAVVVEEAAHTGGEATCEHKAKCEVCNAEYGKLADHKGGTATCTDKAKCDVCGEAYGEKNADKHTKEAKWTITGDKHSKAYECCGKVVVEEAAHTGGEATCEHKAVCSVCNAEYGALAAHKGGEATCTDKAKCDVCGEAYGEKNADKHTKEAKWTITGDKHSKAYECCGKVVVAEEAHEWKDGKCEECGYEAAPGTEQKPIEIPADKETVKEEAKVEAGDEQHYELDEKMAGMTITIKGEGAYAIIEGKKYEAVNGVLEVKLPAKTGKIPVIIGNAGTKAGTFSITVATPSEDNSDTGDNTAIVLLGSLMALSVLAAGVLLVPDIRKKLMK